MVDVRGSSDSNSNKYNTHSIAEGLIKLLQKADQQNQFCLPSEKVDITSVSDQWRQHDFYQRFSLDSDGTIRPNPGKKAQTQQPDNTTSVKAKTVVISFSHGCLHQASILYKFLKKQKSVSVTVQFLALPQSSGAQAPRLQLLDSADMVVVMMSDDYMESAHHRHELHIALCRQRMTKDQQVLYLIQTHHSKLKPVYPHLLPHSINLGDKHWFSLARKAGMLKSTESFKVQLPGGVEVQAKCSGRESLALMTAAVDVAEKLTSSEAGDDSGITTNIVNLANLVRLGEPGTVPVEKCLLPFSALNSNPKMAPRHQENMRHQEEVQKQLELLMELEEMEELATPPKQKVLNMCLAVMMCCCTCI